MNLPIEWANKVIGKSEEIKSDLVKPPETSDKVAVIIEFRNDMFLLHVIRVFLYHLAPKGFSFLFIHGTDNALLAKTFIEPLGVTLKEIPVKNITVSQYCGMLGSKKFWEELHSEHVLIYQIDTYIRHGNIEQYLEYDYVGAPWHPEKCRWCKSKSRVGNGGLSLRRRSAMLRCLSTRTTAYDDSEDIYFSVTCEDLLNLPPIEVAKSFSVETWEHPNPFGFHKPWAYLPSEYVYSLM